MIYYIGDVHGELTSLWGYIFKYDLRNCSFVSVGDFGFGFPYRREDWIIKLNRKLGKRNIHLFVARGNHDDPAFFDGRYFNWCSDFGGVDSKYPYIHLVPDGKALNIYDKWHFFCGGAISIDRCLRTEGRDYWRDEGFECPDFSLIDAPRIDVVVTHNCPSRVLPVNHPQNCENPILNYSLKDQMLVDSLCDELKEIDRLEKFLLNRYTDIESWFFGHYHVSSFNSIEGIKYKCLNISEICE